jgi:PAS domain S-box-containing protein
LGGLATVKRSLIRSMFAEVLELSPGRSGFAYMVDGHGRVIYHRHSAQLTEDFSGTDQVREVTNGRTGSVLAEDVDVETVVSGFAPVPNTGWGIVTQERWSNVVGPIRDYGKVVLGLLIFGGVLASGAIFLATGRILRPVKDLTQGAQRIAGGDFGYRIESSSNDEIQALGQQFNSMAGALKASYSDLEEKIASRTMELSESEERYRALFEQSRDAIFITEEGKVQDANQAALDLFGYSSEEAIGLDLDNVYLDTKDRGEFGRLLDKQGSVKDFEVRFQKRNGEPMDCLVTASLRLDENGRRIGVQGVVRDITDVKRYRQTEVEQARDLAVLEERNRMAREIHDTMAQGFTGIVLQLEAGEQAFEDSPDQIRSNVNRAKDLARTCLQEARRSV